MEKYIAIDGGTTNTRICYVCGGQVKDAIKLSIGARAGMEHKQRLKDEVKSGIAEILARNYLSYKEIRCIILSGMITSEGGLYNLPHISVPAGIKELHNGMVHFSLPDVSDIPFACIPGVKMSGGQLENTDMMRGEETELVGLFGKLTDGVYILPGSHSKIIQVHDGKITDFFTMLTGEMAFSLSQNTILKQSVSFETGDVLADWLKKGFLYCKEKGINEALFKTRVLDTLFHEDAAARYSFFMGAVMCGEVLRVIEMQPKKAMIAGKEQLKKITEILLTAFSDIDVVCVGKEEASAAPALGAVAVFEFQSE